MTVDQKEEHKIDFRVPGLSHSVVKEAEHLRVQEHVKGSKLILIDKHFMPTCSRITSAIHSAKIPREMIRGLGNVELFELCDTTQIVQCYHCLLYWEQGIVYCTCGQCLIYRESRRNFHRLRLDALSIPNYVIKKGATHGARHGKTMEQREYHLAWILFGRDAARELTPNVNILRVFTIDVSEIQFIVNHNSQSDGQNKSAKSGMNLRKKTFLTNSLQRKGEDTRDNDILF